MRSFSSERTMTQTIDYHRAQNPCRLDNIPSVAADSLARNGRTDTTALESWRGRGSIPSAQPRPNQGSMPGMAKHLELVREASDRAKARTRGADGRETISNAFRDVVHPGASI